MGMSSGFLWVSGWRVTCGRHRLRALRELSEQAFEGVLLFEAFPFRQAFVAFERAALLLLGHVYPQ